MRLSIYVDSKELALDLVSSLSREDVMQLFVEIDQQIAEVDFTETVAAYFISETKKEYELAGIAFDPNKLTMRYVHVPL